MTVIFLSPSFYVARYSVYIFYTIKRGKKVFVEISEILLFVSVGLRGMSVFD